MGLRDGLITPVINKTHLIRPKMINLNVNNCDDFVNYHFHHLFMSIAEFQPNYHIMI